eukprot:7954765-Pyramimonas_sp.AAC.1
MPAGILGRLAAWARARERGGRPVSTPPGPARGDPVERGRRATDASRPSEAAVALVRAVHREPPSRLQGPAAPAAPWPPCRDKDGEALPDRYDVQLPGDLAPVARAHRCNVLDEGGELVLEVPAQKLAHSRDLVEEP